MITSFEIDVSIAVCSLFVIENTFLIQENPGRWMIPREPTSSVMREVLYPEFRDLCWSSSYLALFLSAAPSNDVSKQIVSSISSSLFFPSSQHTMSGRKVVGTICCGNWYSDKSEVICSVGWRWLEIVLAITSSTAS